MADTPYGADNERRIIYINPKLVAKLSRFERRFWIEHDKCHINLNTNYELAADRYMFNRLAGKEYKSLKQMIEAAENLLDENKPYHQERTDQLYLLALDWDRKHPETHIQKTTRNDVAMQRTTMNGISDAMLNLGTILHLQSQDQTDATTSASNSSNTIIIMAIAAVIVLKLLQK